MKEIGGYIELEHYTQPMLHDGAIALNCGRNALAYLLEAKHIEKIAMPKFMCDSCECVFQRYHASVRYYSVNLRFEPRDFDLEPNEWLYLVNYYGQLSNETILRYVQQYQRVIVDNAQAYFQMPLQGVDTLYTCRKFFGVADGAFLYTDTQLQRELPRDESFDRMRFLLGRFERSASEFYAEYVENNHRFTTEPIRSMSPLTTNLLCGLNYKEIKRKRTENFIRLQEELEPYNQLHLTVPQGAFMYPLYLQNGAVVRKRLQEKKIYIPTLWPAVFTSCHPSEPEYGMAENILPLPVDQRYGVDEMEYMVREVQKCIG